MDALRTAVVMDYQNVHLTAHDVFDRHGDKHDALIDPVKFGQTAVRRRNERQRPGFPAADLSGVFVYRGLPHTDYDWEQNRRCMEQAAQWRSDGADVTLRDLKYKFQRAANGHPIRDINGHKIPTGPGQEKGVDVLVALTCLRQALMPNIELVILASRDTDLVPTLDTMYDMRLEDPSIAKIETVSWYNKNAAAEGNYAGGNLRASGGRKIWNTNLDRRCFEATRDRRDYS